MKICLFVFQIIIIIDHHYRAETPCFFVYNTEYANNFKINKPRPCKRKI